MSECIVYKKPLTKNEMFLNMTFHSKCCSTVIQNALDILGWTKPTPPGTEVKE